MPELKNPSNEFLIKFSRTELELLIEACDAAELLSYKYAGECVNKAMPSLAEQHSDKAKNFYKLSKALVSM